MANRFGISEERYNNLLQNKKTTSQNTNRFGISQDRYDTIQTNKADLSKSENDLGVNIDLLRNRPTTKPINEAQASILNDYDGLGTQSTYKPSNTLVGDVRGLIEQYKDVELPKSNLSPIESAMKGMYERDTTLLRKEQIKSGNKNISASIAKGLGDNAVINLAKTGINKAFNLLAPEKYEYNKEDIQSTIDKYNKAYEENKSTGGEMAGNAMGLMALLGTGEGALQGAGVLADLGATGLQGASITNMAGAEIGRGMIAESVLKGAQIATGEYTPTEALKQMPQELLFETMGVGIGRVITKKGIPLLTKNFKNVKTDEVFEELDEAVKTIANTRNLDVDEISNLKAQIDEIKGGFDSLKAIDSEEAFIRWRKQNFDGAYGKVPKEDMGVLKELYTEDTGLKANTGEQPFASLKEMSANAREPKKYIDFRKDNNTLNLTHAKSSIRIATNKVKEGYPLRITDKTRQVFNKLDGKKWSELSEPEKLELDNARKQMEFASNNKDVFIEAQDVSMEGIKSSLKNNKFLSDKAVTGSVFDKDTHPILNKLFDNQVVKGLMQFGDERTIATILDPEDGDFSKFISKSARANYDGKQATLQGGHKLFSDEGLDFNQILSNSKHRKPTNAFNFGDNNVKISDAEQMYMHLIAKNPDLVKEMKETGILFVREGKPNIKIKPTEKELLSVKVPSKLKGKDKVFEKYFKEFSYPKANDVYKKIFGVDLGERKNYIPVLRGVDNVKLTGDADFDITNMDASIYKSRTGSTEPFVIQDIFEATENNIKQVSKAQVEPYIMDLERILNDNEFQELSSRIIGQKSASGKNIIQDYFERFAKDMRSTNYKETLGVEKWYNNIINKVIGSKVIWGALTTAPKQFGSLPLASTEIKPQYLAKGLADITTNPKKAISEMVEKFPEIKMRAEGKFNREASAIAEAGHTKFTKQLVDKGMTVTKGVDLYTVSSIYKGAELEIDATTMLIKGSEPYNEAVRELALKGLRTQPNYSETFRAPFLKTKNPLMKIATSYTTAQSRGTNALIENGIKMIHGVKGAGNKMATTIGAIVAGTAYTTYIDLKAWDLGKSQLYNKQDKEKEAVTKFASNLSTTIPVVGKMIGSVISGFEIQDMTKNEVNKFVRGVKKLPDVVSKEKFEKEVKALAEGKITQSEYNELVGKKITEIVVDVLELPTVLGSGISPKKIKGQMDIGAGLLPISKESRVDFQTLDNPLEKAQLYNKMEAVDDEEFKNALFDKVQLTTKTEGRDEFTNIGKYTPEMRSYLQENARFISDKLGFPKRLDQINTISKSTKIEPEKIVNAYLGVREHWKEKSNEGYPSKYKEAIMRRYLEELNLNGKKNDTLVADWIAEVMLGYKNKD